MFGRRFIRRLAARAFPQLADLGPRLGAIESAFQVLADDSRYANDDGAFNGQAMRREVTTRILRAMQPARIVETGTFLGDTTGYFAGFGAPVVSCEMSAALHFAASRRLAAFSNITLKQGDSREMLGQLVAAGAHAASTFFYLDAHWRDDLPLPDEIRIIVEHWESCIILVDDFEVPGDPGYGHDDYGWNKVLNYACIAPSLRDTSIEVFFPKTPSDRETGARRGCVFLAKGTANTAILRGAESLFPFAPRRSWLAPWQDAARHAPVAKAPRA